MQSKTSSSKLFSKTLFFKNIKNCWPVWGAYSFFLFWLFPGIMYFNSIYGSQDVKKRLVLMIYQDGFNVALVTAVIIGIITAMTTFAYLQKERSISFFHSLPLTRGSLYFTNFISGITIMFVPNIIAAIITACIGFSYKVNIIPEVLQWFLIVSAEDLFFYSFAVLCMILCGQLVSAPILYLIFIFYFDAILIPVNEIASRLFYGISSNLLRRPDGVFGIIFPVTYMAQIDYSVEFDEHTYEAVRYYLQPKTYTIIAAALGAVIIIIAASVIMYRSRKSESSGDIIAIRVLRPIFRWGFGISLSVFITWLIQETVLYDFSHTDVARVSTQVIFIIIASVGFWAAEMILKKSFRVFKRKYKEWIIFAVFTIIITCSYMFIGKARAYKIPNVNDVESVDFYAMGYNTTFKDKAAIIDIIDLHRYMVNNNDEMNRINEDWDYNYSSRINISENLKNGEVITRSYNVTGEHLKRLEEFCNKYTIDLAIGDIDFNRIESAHTTLRRDIAYDKGLIEYEYQDYVFDKQDSIELMKAIIADYKAEKINIFLEMNSVYYKPIAYEEGIVQEENSKHNGYITFTIVNLDTSYEFSTYDYKNLTVNDDCTNFKSFIEGFDFPDGYYWVGY